MAEPVDPKKIKDLKIKTGVVRRIAKEKVSYQMEADQQQEKINKMKAGDHDEHVLRKQMEVLEESRQMVPDCERRLITAWDDLNKIVEQSSELVETAEYKSAKEILEETRATAKR